MVLSVALAAAQAAAGGSAIADATHALPSEAIVARFGVAASGVSGDAVAFAWHDSRGFDEINTDARAIADAKVETLIGSMAFPAFSGAVREIFIPSPGSIALLGLGSLAMGRRRGVMR